MKNSDAARLLARAAAYDKRTASQVEAQAWAEAIPDHYELEDCIDALVRHFRTSTDYLMPAHIVDLVPIVVRDRQDAAARDRGLTRTHEAPPGRARAVTEQIKAQLRARKDQAS
jgi:hypothetical protein